MARGFISGATGFVVGGVERGPKDMEDFGYVVEQAILFATSLGLGTCWLGGTFSKSAFAEKANLGADETMPAVVAVGAVAHSGRSSHATRRRAWSDRRLAADQLFFESRFGSSLSRHGASSYHEVLEAVRRAPSASNKQPWRIVRVDDDWHFFLQRTKGYAKGSALFAVLRLADLQRVDMGIAMCHFELAAQELGVTGHWVDVKPDVVLPDGSTEYVITWRAT